MVHNSWDIRVTEIWSLRWEWKSNQQARKRKTTSLILPHPRLFLFISSSLSLSAPLSHMSFFPDTCLPFPLVSLSYLLLCGVELFVLWRFVYGGRNTPLLQAASSLSAHHTLHDSPPSLWSRDEQLLPSPWGVRFFCFVLFFLNFTSRQRIDTVCVSCFRPCRQTLCNSAMMWTEVTVLYIPVHPRGTCYLLKALFPEWSQMLESNPNKYKTSHKKENQTLNLFVARYLVCSSAIICDVWTLQLVIIAIKLGPNSGKHESWSDCDWPLNVKSDTDNL